MASFEKRGNKFRAVVSYKNAQGLRKKESKTFDKKKDATKWAADLENKINNGYDAANGKQLFPEYFEEWFKTYKVKSVRPVTMKSYNAWIKATYNLFPAVTMDKLSTPLLQRELDKYGETHSTIYVKHYLSMIKSALKDAQIDGVITKDIYSRLKAHGTDTRTLTKDNYLSATDFEKLQAYLYEHTEDFHDRPFLLLVLIAMETGARLGEIHALTQSDIDVINLNIQIGKSYSPADPDDLGTKNEASKRSVGVSNSLIDVLVNYMKLLDRDELFTPTSNATVSDRIKVLTKEVGIKQIRFHGLRHSHVSYLLHNDVNIRYVSERIGHANTKITQETYAHMLPEMKSSQESRATNLFERTKKED